MQEKRFDAKQLNAIADSLSPRNSRWPNSLHRTPFLGNYDVSVLEVALQDCGLNLVWHDVRDVELVQLDLDACFGLIVNMQSTGYVSRLLNGRHWIAFKKLHGRWVNLDSKLVSPQLISDRNELEGNVAMIQYLQSLQRDSIIFKVIKSAPS